MRLWTTKTQTWVFIQNTFKVEKYPESWLFGFFIDISVYVWCTMHSTQCLLNICRLFNLQRSRNKLLILLVSTAVRRFSFRVRENWNTSLPTGNNITACVITVTITIRSCNWRFILSNVKGPTVMSSLCRVFWYTFPLITSWRITRWRNDALTKISWPGRVNTCVYLL